MGNCIVGGPDEAILISGPYGVKTFVGGCGCEYCMCETTQRLPLGMLTLHIESDEAETKNGVPMNMKAVCQVKVKSSVFRTAHEYPRNISEQDRKTYTGPAYAKDEIISRAKADELQIDTTEEINLEMIQRAAQNWLAVAQDYGQLKDCLTGTMEGHQRQIMGQMEPIDLYQSRERFINSVNALVTKDLDNMGYECVSYVVTKLWDHNGYMKSLGMTATAQVVKQGQVGQAKEISEAEIAKALHQSEKDQKVKLYTTNAEVEQHKQEQNIVSAEKDLALHKQLADKEVAMKKSEYKIQVDGERAKAEAVHDIETAKQKQKLVEENEKQLVEKAKVQVLLEKEKIEATRVQKQESIKIDLAVATTNAEKQTVDSKGQAEVLAIKKERDARAEETAAAHLAAATKIKANAEAESIEEVGRAHAAAKSATGLAETEFLGNKAVAYEKFGEAYLIQCDFSHRTIVEALPAVAERIAAPLAQTEKMVFISSDGQAGSQVVTDVAKMISSVPEVLKMVTDGQVDVGSLLSSLQKRKPMAGTQQ